MGRQAALIPDGPQTDRQQTVTRQTHPPDTTARSHFTGVFYINRLCTQVGTVPGHPSERWPGVRALKGVSVHIRPDLKTTREHDNDADGLLLVPSCMPSLLSPHSLTRQQARMNGTAAPNDHCSTYVLRSSRTIVP